MKKVLLPVDGSIGCQKVLDTAEKLATNYDSVVTVFNVYDHPHSRNTDNFIPDENKTQEISPNADSFIPQTDKPQNIVENEEMVAKTVEHLKGKGVKAEGKVVIGDPAAEILDEAKNEGYDLVVMCTHGMSTSKRFLLGSVTNKVVHHIDIPIMIIR
ncbi:Nucleotide-binding universal stress protein, UspA family [Dethiosulfatibacter aminovorans DSM 17477]|uniref:Nucleotide-binding universal stress protein, UspA family n=1 Tax=Dethiosulfatibacter aminovorans DSM 17477 TaxID=1121476 RepID=A0A1M6J006_9FIRM|nr:universal stress protein [Dethiosulfatibacter aminovorans]SHJ39922.1 Nucleotide-binding universal stress protein, UspA family [Dethiosulfatibacter aminovorans DSM 17477]